MQSILPKEAYNPNLNLKEDGSLSDTLQRLKRLGRGIESLQDSEERERIIKYITNRYINIASMLNDNKRLQRLFLDIDSFRKKIRNLDEESYFKLTGLRQQSGNKPQHAIRELTSFNNGGIIFSAEVKTEDRDQVKKIIRLGLSVRPDTIAVRIMKKKDNELYSDGWQQYNLGSKYTINSLEVSSYDKKTRIIGLNINLKEVDGTRNADGHFPSVLRPVKIQYKLGNELILSEDANQSFTKAQFTIF